MRRAWGGYLKLMSKRVHKEGKTLAAELGWAPSKVSRVFTGQTVKAETYALLSRHLGISLAGASREIAQLADVIEATEHHAQRAGRHTKRSITGAHVVDDATPILTVTMEKGGVGKTTLSTGVAAELALMGRRVLLVDLDAQANATAMMAGEYDAQDDGAALLAALKGQGEPPVLATDHGVDVVPSGRHMADAELGLRGMPGAGFRQLERMLQRITADYDVVVVDTPPALGAVSTAAIFASSHLILPVKPDGFSLDAMMRTLRVFDEVRDVLQGSFTLLGCAVLGWRNTVVTREALKDLRGIEGLNVLEPYLSHSTLYSEANYARLPLPLVDPQHKAAKEFRRLTRRIEQLVQPTARLAEVS
ncbi:MAG: ParA family protein [Myxococcota bacterium]